MRVDLRRVADLEANPQLVGAVVEQQDGEDLVGDEGADQLGGAAEQGLQVERGVERVGETHEIGQIGRLNADVAGVQRGDAGRRAVIAFRLRFAPPTMGDRGSIRDENRGVTMVTSSLREMRARISSGDG